MIVQIEKLAVGGAGVARHDGLVIFVNEAAPGDRLEIRITEKKKNFAFAEIVKILEPGPGRREAPCPYAGSCGGCNWQHLNEDEQRRQKSLLLRETLEKFLRRKDLPLEEIVPSPRALRYRNRIQPQFAGGKLGFFKRRSQEVLPVEDCLIAEEALTALFREVPAELDSKTRVRLEFWLDENAKARWTRMDEEKDGFGFSQVNRYQNEDLRRSVVEWAQGSAPTAIWDLYAGSGNFTFPLANAFPGIPLTAVEMSSLLVQRGREQARPGVDFVASDVAAFLQQHSVPKDALVFLDPPRAGTDEAVMKTLATSQARRVLYLSCHPVSLARDLSVFFAASSRPWRLERIRPFEMFPQTDHLETLVQLSVDSP